MIIEILKIGQPTDLRALLQIRSFLEKGEKGLLPEGNSFLDLALPQPIPIAFYKNAHGSLPANVKWEHTDKPETPISYKPFFFPRNPKARVQDHYAGKTCFYLRIPGTISLGYLNQSQFPQFEAWYRCLCSSENPAMPS